MTAGPAGRTEVDGLAVHRRPPTPPDPSAARVVAVHGALDRSASFARTTRELRDLDVTRYDRRGYGRSAAAGAPAAGDAALDAHVDDLCRVVGEGPAVLLGHSMGGLVALAAAARRPGLASAVVAYEPPTPWAPWWGGTPTWDGGGVDPAEVAERFLRRMAGDDAWEGLPSATRDARRSEGTALIGDLTAARGRPFDPAALAVPVVLAVGSESDQRHRRGVELLGDELPRAEVVVVAGAGHGGHLTHPVELAGLVRRAIAAAAAGGARAAP